MIAVLCAWLVLAALTLPVGIAVTALACAGDVGPLRFNQVIIALWCGLLVQCCILLALAAAVPLDPWGAVVMAGVSSAAAIHQRDPLACLLRCWLRAPRSYVLAVAILSLAVAFIATSRVVLYDSGLYHIPIARWLADYGLVPGLALLHVRFGLASPWFAIVAVFDAGPLQGRMAAVANAYLVLLMSVQALFVFSRLLTGQREAGDWLLASGLGLIIVHAIWVNSAVSASPDLPVAALAILIGYLMLIAGDRIDCMGRAKTGPAIIAVLLGAAAVALKLSAAPALLASGLFYAWQNRAVPARIMRAALLAVGVLLPSLAANLITSGCLAFPLALGCAALPWTVSATELDAFQHGITAFARWYEPMPTGAGPLDWLVSWLFHPRNRLNPPLFLLALASLAVLGLTRFIRRRTLRVAEIWALGLALSSLLFVLVTAPDMRFAIGPIALLFGLAVTTTMTAENGRDRSSKSPATIAQPAHTMLSLAFVIGLGLIALRVLVVDRRDAVHWAELPYAGALKTELGVTPSARLLLPPTLPIVFGVTQTRDGHSYELEKRRSADVVYGIPPMADQCWGTKTPCTPELAAPIRLRRPPAGIGAGFARAEP